MGYIESAAFFCCATETVADMANASWHAMRVSSHPLEKIASTPPSANSNAATGHIPPEFDANIDNLFAHLPESKRATAQKYVDCYVDAFCLLVQGGPVQGQNAQRHLFHTIDCLFQPNNAANITRKEPNLLKKLHKGNTCWVTHQKLLGWVIDTLRLHLTLPQSCFKK
eukprot:15327611-Ditylum_brightwellii.AAC.1